MDGMWKEEMCASTTSSLEGEAGCLGERFRGLAAGF
jgi:hypothetical protein